MKPIDLCNAVNFLNEAAEVLGERGKTYNPAEPGERSMARIVAAFNAIRGHNLTEADGWAFMLCLKQVRAAIAPAFHHDSHVDTLGYAALLAECEQATGKG